MSARDVFVAFVLILLASLVAGCGNQALKTNAVIARAMLEAQAESGPVIRELRKRAGVEAGTEAHAVGLPEADAQAAASAAASEWQCAVDGHGILAAAVGAYIDSLVIWQAGAPFQLSDALPFISRVVEAYRALRSCLDSLDARELDRIVLETPRFLVLTPPEWGIAEVAQ